MSWGEAQPGGPAGHGEPLLDLDHLLARMAQAGASDLHMTVGAPPTMRVRGSMVPLSDTTPLAGRQLRESSTPS